MREVAPKAVGPLTVQNTAQAFFGSDKRLRNTRYIAFGRSNRAPEGESRSKDVERDIQMVEAADAGAATAAGSKKVSSSIKYSTSIIG